MYQARLMGNSWVIDYVRYLVARIHCGTRVVDHMVDSAKTAEKDGQDVVQFHSRINRDFERTCGMDGRAPIKEAVAAQPPRFMHLDRVSHLVSCKAVDTIMRPGYLVRRVIRHLVLEEDSPAVLAIPDEFVLLVMLHEQTVSGHVIAIDNDAGIGSVERPTH